MQRPFRACVPHFILALLGAGLLVAGCGSDDSNPAKPDQPTPVGGNVNKAPIAGATVNVYAIHPDGSRGALVAGPFTTNATGDWSGAIPAGPAGKYMVVSAAGSYTDEATGAVVTISATQELYGVLPGASCAVTPLTHATVLGIQDMVAGGTSLSSAIAQAATSSTAAFGFNIATTSPSDAATATTNQKKYAALLGGLSTVIEDNFTTGTFASTPRFDLVIALAKDISDGKLDGIDASGASIDVATDATGTATAALPALSGTDLSAWLTAANTYAASQTNLAGITFTTTTAWNPSAPPTGGGGSGGTVTFSGSATTTGNPMNGHTTFTPDVSYFHPGPNYVWTDNTNHVEITVVPGSGAAVATIYVVYSGITPSAIWSAYDVNGPTGATISGGQTTFNGSTLPEIISSSTELVINGTLQIPTTPAP